MAVSKRTRYEVLNRDGFACRYCHATDTELTIDHVVPVALGGSDAPMNLVAACWDCNAGKSSTSPSASTVAEVDADAIRWSKAVRRAGEKMVTGRPQDYEWFISAWGNSWDKNLSELPHDYQLRVTEWLQAGLPQEVILQSLDVALWAYGVSPENTFRYLCGVIRNRIEELHVAARALIDAENE